MKAILCGICVDIRALPPNGSVTCRCGNVTAEWVDAQRGTARVQAYSPQDVRMIGIHNGFLKYAFHGEKGHPDHEWRAFHELLAKNSGNSLFAEDRRNAPVVIFRVGETNDVWWWEPPKTG